MRVLLHHNDNEPQHKLSNLLVTESYAVCAVTDSADSGLCAGRVGVAVLVSDALNKLTVLDLGSVASVVEDLTVDGDNVTLDRLVCELVVSCTVLVHTVDGEGLCCACILDVSVTVGCLVNVGDLTGDPVELGCLCTACKTVSDLDSLRDCYCVAFLLGLLTYVADMINGLGVLTLALSLCAEVAEMIIICIHAFCKLKVTKIANMVIIFVLAVDNWQTAIIANSRLANRPLL